MMTGREDLAHFMHDELSRKLARVLATLRRVTKNGSSRPRRLKTACLQRPVVADLVGTWPAIEIRDVLRHGLDFPVQIF